MLKDDREPNESGREVRLNDAALAMLRQMNGGREVVSAAQRLWGCREKKSKAPRDNGHVWLGDLGTEQMIWARRLRASKCLEEEV